MTIELGKLSEEESKELKKLSNRKNALIELLKSLQDDSLNRLYDKIMSDYTETSAAISDWWQKAAAEHGWEYERADGWSVDFGTNTVFLNKA